MINSTRLELCKIIGKPWVSMACGPDAFDCWGVIEYYAKLSGLNVEQFKDVDHEDSIDVCKKIQKEKSSGKWLESSIPLDGDIVLMYEGDRCCHVGLYIDKHFLHSIRARDGFRGGVCLHSRATINKLFNKLEFYRIA